MPSFRSAAVFVCLCSLLLVEAIPLRALAPPQDAASELQQAPPPPAPPGTGQKPSAPQTTPPGIEQRPSAPQTTPPGTEQRPSAPQVPPATQPAPSGASHYQSSDSQLSFGLFYFASGARPKMRKGEEAPSNANPSEIDFPGTNQPFPGGILNIPAGKNNTLRISYLRMRGKGSITAGKPLAFFGTDYSQGDTIDARYTLQNAKASLDFLTWPFPVESSWRLKTLWEVQYTGVHSTFSDKTASTADNPIESQGTNWFIYPSFGLGLEKFVSRNVRFVVKGAGFALPGRSNIWDAQAYLAVHTGQIEISFGGRAFHFRTSPKHEEYVRATLPGAFLEFTFAPK